MSIVKEPRELIFGIGEGGALTNPQWKYERFVVDGESREAVGFVFEPATPEEIEAYLGTAFVAVQSQTNSAQETITRLTAQRDAALLAAQKVAAADAAWDEQVRPFVTAANAAAD